MTSGKLLTTVTNPTASPPSEVLAAPIASAFDAIRSLDIRGGVNVLDYGVKGDGTSDDTGGIIDAFAASEPGDVVIFPNTGSAYRTSQVIDIPDHRSVQGFYQEIWPYSPNGISPHPNSIRALGTHTGIAIFRMQGKEITGSSLEMSNVRIRNLMLDAVAAPADVVPFFAEGRCRDIMLECVTAASATTAGSGGHGFYFTQGTGDGIAPPRGIRMRSCVAWGNAGDGFWFDKVTDFDLYDLLAVTNHGNAGIHITSPHESVVSHSRSVFNDGNGWWIDGSSPSISNNGWGQFTMIAPATDRNGLNGILVENTGVGPISIVAPRCRRDASLNNSTDSGLKIRGPGGTPTCPVEVIGGQSTVGVNDDGSGTEGPLYGLRVLDTSRVSIVGGLWWGLTKGFGAANTNADLTVTRESRFSEGPRSAKIVQTPPVGIDVYQPQRVAATSSSVAPTADVTLVTTGSSADVTITLPTAVGISGRTYLIAKVDAAGSKKVIIATTSSQKFNSGTFTNAATISSPASARGHARVTSDGANWLVEYTDGTWT